MAIGGMTLFNFIIRSGRLRLLGFEIEIRSTGSLIEIWGKFRPCRLIEQDILQDKSITNLISKKVHK